ncbi:MAG TPA: SUMF1/EgtB/PvdO family nonheme iron enzyme [Verrucomicrobiae bacterium]|nr:SUMF1/EgtB/PvdO family nonheme iron enzyme [Verrucomicrobiae bacterium]
MRMALWGVIAAAFFPKAVDAAPSVSNVRASQREGAKLVDVYYDLSGATPLVTVSVKVSTNNGVSYDLPTSSFSGDMGVGVTNAVGLHIVWDAGADWDGQYSPSMRFKVTASEHPSSGFVLIPAGNFQMGDTFTEGDTEERPVHTVYVSAFYMQATEVTKAQWDDVKAWASTHGYTDLYLGEGRASNHPVHTVAWYDVVKWCNARGEKEGLTPCYYTTSAKTTVYRTGIVNVANGAVDWNANGYRLPTEAEWEKAARGGASGRRFPWSDADTITHGRANYKSSSLLDAYDVSPTQGYHPTFETGLSPYTSPAGYFAANGYGLYDMAGNVWEWCWDWYGSGYYGSSPSSDPLGPPSGSNRVLRGGDWNSSAFICRVAAREDDDPTFTPGRYGFRPVRR